MGGFPSGEDSIAKQVAPMTHWPDMRILVLVVSIVFVFFVLIFHEECLSLYTLFLDFFSRICTNLSVARYCPEKMYVDILKMNV